MKFIPAQLLALLLLFGPLCINAQEENGMVATQGNRYVSLRMKSLEKCDKRVKRQQDHLLKKLKKREVKFAGNLKKTDSAGYAKFKNQPVSYDSIQKLAQNDSLANSNKQISPKQKNGVIDTLKGIESFVQKQPGMPSGGNTGIASQNSELNSLRNRLNARSLISQLITKRTSELKDIASDGSGTGGFKSIEKQAFYGKSKMQVFKDIEEEPTKLEDKSLEYLQGTEGFDKSLATSTTGGGGANMQTIGSGGGIDPTQLSKMGFQTKGLLQNNLQQKFGAALGPMSKQIGGELSDWQNKGKEIKQDIGQAKSSFNQVKNTQKPSFKVNPMRGLPFWKRFQKQYSWQATRASSDGKVPATMTPALLYGFKHTPKLIYGAGLGLGIGLGQNWQNVRFSYQGLGYKTFVTWKWIYGIGFSAGYERTYSSFTFGNKSAAVSSPDVLVPNQHINSIYTESLLIGLTKSYKINSKYTGQIQLVYDLWWQQKGLTSPFVIRVETIKN